MNIAERIKMDVPAECKVLCFCQQKHLQMPPVVNPVKQETLLAKTNESPFNMSGFGPANTFVSKLSKGSEQPP